MTSLIWLLTALAQAEDTPPAEEAPPSDVPADAPPPVDAPPPADAPPADAPPPVDAPPADAQAAAPAPVDRTPPRRRSRDDSFMGFGSNSLMIGYGGAYGMYLGGSLGWVVNENATATGALFGGALGAGTAVMFGPEDPNVHQAVLLGSSSTLGSFTGIQLARTFIPFGAEAEYDRIVLAGALGSLAGTGLGLTMLDAPPHADLMWRSDVGALVGWQMAAAGLDMAGLDPVRDRNVRAPLALAGAYGMGGAVYALGAFADVRPNGELMALSLAHGAWFGLWSPYVFTDAPTEEQRSGGFRMGLGAGYITALALSPVVEPGAKTMTLQVVAMGAGNALGAGLPLALGVDPDASARPIVAPMLAGSAAGQIGGALLAPIYEASANDIAMVGALGAWTGYQAIGWGFYGAHLGSTPSAATGYALTTAGGGTVVALALVPVVELSPAESAMMTSMGAWGTWYGGWGGHLLRADPATHWLGTLTAGNVGLVGTAVVVASPVETDWRSVGVVNGMGLLGGAGGALVGVVASPDVDVVASSSLVGSTIGLGAGAVMAMRDDTGGASDLLLPEIALEGGRVQYRPSFAVSPWMDDEGDPGAWVELTLHEEARAW